MEQVAPEAQAKGNSCCRSILQKTFRMCFALATIGPGTFFFLWLLPDRCWHHRIFQMGAGTQ
jgi:hypothetical protein